jgi:CRISPR/Cas system CSM-associated protein Csm2 small subunit
MVIGLLAITAIPTVTGIALGCSEQRKQNRREDDEKRMEKFYTDVECTEDGEEASELDGKRVVLRNNKVRVFYPIIKYERAILNRTTRSTSTTHPLQTAA